LPMPLVSVILPNYNHALYLRKRIECILAQTFTDWELIILDDCSTDQSRELIEAYRDHPAVRHIVYNDSNSGSTFRQWKKGLELAAGEWIWIAESDDYCDSNFLACLMDITIPVSVGLRYALSCPVDGADQRLEEALYHPRTGTYSGTAFLKEHLLQLNRIPNASAVVVRKDLLADSLTPQLQGYRLLADWMVWCTVVLQTNVYYTEATHNYHRYHTANVRSRLFKEGSYYEEFPAFRLFMKVAIAQSAAVDKGILLQINRISGYKETGYRAVELWRKGDYGKSLPLLLKASLRPAPTLYFIKSIIYWMKKDRAHQG